MLLVQVLPVCMLDGLLDRNIIFAILKDNLV